MASIIGSGINGNETHAADQAVHFIMASIIGSGINGNAKKYRLKSYGDYGFYYWKWN